MVRSSKKNQHTNDNNSKQNNEEKTQIERKSGYCVDDI